MEPIEIAEFEKNKAEKIRIEISEFKGNRYLNIRTWYIDKEGNWAPTKKGVAIALEKFADFKKAIETAEIKIREFSQG